MRKLLRQCQYKEKSQPAPLAAAFWDWTFLFIIYYTTAAIDDDEVM